MIPGTSIGDTITNVMSSAVWGYYGPVIGEQGNGSITDATGTVRTDLGTFAYYFLKP